MTRGSNRPGRLATSHAAICPSSRRRSSRKVAAGGRLAESSIHEERMYWQAAVKLICRGFGTCPGHLSVALAQPSPLSQIAASPLVLPRAGINALATSQLIALSARGTSLARARQ